MSYTAFRVAAAATIRTTRIELVTPFPCEDLKLAYEWLHAGGDGAEDDDGPSTAEGYASEMALTLIRCVSYGLRRTAGEDGWIGLIYCEPAGARNGYLHVALSRRAWGYGLADEAVSAAIRDLFERFPEWTRLSVAMIESNRAARALALRMGFRLEAEFPDMVVQGGTPRSVVHYGLTRREWERRVGAKTGGCHGTNIYTGGRSGGRGPRREGRD